jgi:hypothetical protein
MAREPIPKKLRDAVLAEYNHRCAVCGNDRPQLHHIDEDSSNSISDNLLPLCPNCHLSDQHNPTRQVEVKKLHLFRRFKDPGILKPQFHPVYKRQLFLDDVVVCDEPVQELFRQVTELRELVKALEMGDFYFNRLGELLALEFPYYQICLALGTDPDKEAERMIGNRRYRQKLVTNRESARDLLVEQLRYQRWANET